MDGIIKKIRGIKLRPYNVFTFAAAFYILGILLGNYIEIVWSSSWLAFAMIICALVLSAHLNYLLGNKALVLLSWLILFLLCGMANFSYSESRFCKLSTGEQTLNGTIVNNPLRDFKQQEVILSVHKENCQNARILIKLPRFPEYYYGEAMTLQGNLAEPGKINDFDYKRYLKPKFVAYILLNPTRVSVTGRETGWKYTLVGSLYNVKHKLLDSINRSLREPEASLGAGILTGARADISDEMQNELNITGLTHIIALSGFNVTIIIAALIFMLIGFTSRRNLFIAGLIFIFMFVIMTGASASVIRAGILAMLILYGKTIGRKAYQTNLLLLTASLMLLFNPFLLRDDIGFQLSFLAFAGLVYFSKPLSFFLNRTNFARMPKFLAGPIVETLSAQVAVFPLLAFAFGRVSIISPLSNLLVLPSIPLSMLLIFIASIGGLFGIFIGKILGLMAWPLLAYVVYITHLLAKIPYSSISTTKYDLTLILALYGLIGAVYYLALIRMKRLKS